MTSTEQEAYRAMEHGSEPRGASRTERSLRPAHDLAEYVRAYARERPVATALMCFACGFILGWRLKPY